GTDGGYYPREHTSPKSPRHDCATVTQDLQLFRRDDIAVDGDGSAHWTSEDGRQVRSAFVRRKRIRIVDHGVELSPIGDFGARLDFQAHVLFACKVQGQVLIDFVEC